MRITVERAVLLKALAHVQSVVERRNTIPILAHVLLDARDGRLMLTATDMEIAVVEEVGAAAPAREGRSTGGAAAASGSDLPAESERKPAARRESEEGATSGGVVILREGRTTAPAATLYDIVRKLPEGARIELDHPGGDAPLKLRAGRFVTHMLALPVEDFPAMTEGKLPFRFRLPAATLRGLIDRTRFAISTEETRYYLNGIYLHVSEQDGAPMLRAVATDGHRLARVEVPMPEGARGMPGVIVPRKTVNELRKLAEETEGEVEIRLSDTKIQFTLGPVKLTSKLIDGTFPDYERVIPKANDKVLTVAKKQFAEAVARVAAISTERSRPVKLSLGPNLLRLEASSPDQGQAQEELDDGSVEYRASPLEIGFQARYLADITEQIEETVRFEFADGSSPTVVKDAARPDALYVLMPMRV
ncbi:MAG: DNA polymerase III subunit beta [Rhodovarius sp.]|nr:DNA polymerase III subunit beta [Rhodovarius sp.]MCX7931247.1 DNA polymerase III subunit beta [Rhodovarius sp.]MDW8315089.1 DNA polymerase III subunit beta [Rhodovarius sp.]